MKLQEAVEPFISTIVGRELLKSQAKALAVFVASALTLARSILTFPTNSGRVEAAA